MENKYFQPVIELLDRLREKVPIIRADKKGPIQLLDAGHGGIIKGKYTTAPYKMYAHNPDLIFYEGVFNRAVMYAIAYELNEAGRNYILMSLWDEDVPISNRREAIKEWIPGLREAGYIPWVHSIHGNAHGLEQANGFEVYTLPGEDKSDDIASIIFKHAYGLKWNMRKGKEGVDKEARFGILMNDCPSILTEWGFFTNYEQARQMSDPEVIGKIALAVLKADIEIGKSKIL